MSRISPNWIRLHKGDVFVVLLAAGAVVWIAAVLVNPLRRSEESIEARLKKQMPVRPLQGRKTWGGFSPGFAWRLHAGLFKLGPLGRSCRVREILFMRFRFARGRRGR